LDFDENHIMLSGILYPVPRSLGYINRLTGAHGNLAIVHGNKRMTLDDVPVLHPAVMTLEAESLSRIHDDSFYFMVRLIGKNLIVAPRAVILKQYWL
jgi:hypothetical protein